MIIKQILQATEATSQAEGNMRGGAKIIRTFAITYIYAR